MTESSERATDRAATEPSTPTPAPLTTRTPAFLCDQAVVLLVVCGPLLATGTTVGDLLAPGSLRDRVFLVLMAVAFVYHFALEWATGTTLGKRLFGLRAVRDDGRPLDLRGSFLRNALRLIDGLGYWSVAVAIILVRGDGKRLGDAVGRTLVVRSRD